MTGSPAEAAAQSGHGLVLRLECRDAAQAQVIAAALAPDDAPHAAVRAEGSRVVAQARAREVLGLLRTAEDLLACARAAGLA